MEEQTSAASSPRVFRPGLAAVLVAGTIVVIAVVVFAIVKVTGDHGSSRVPGGWKPIVVGSAQFAVPADWPLDDQFACANPDANTVHLALAPPDSGACPGVSGELNVFAGIHQMDPAGILPAVGNPQAGGNITLEDLNGLRTVLDYRDQENFSYDAFVVDEDILIELTWGDQADSDLARQIIDTIGLAPGANPPAIEAPATTIDPFGAAAFQADSHIRSAVQSDPDGAEATAAHLLESLELGQCVPANTVDLGPLTGVANWDQVCHFGRPDGSPTVLELTGVDHVPNITYSTTHPSRPSTCYRKLTGKWWSWYSGSGDAVNPCVAAYVFQGA